MRWICLLMLPFTALACCPCEDKEEKVTLSPEQQARADWYSAYPDWSRVEGSTSEPNSSQHEPLHAAAADATLGTTTDALLVCRVAVDSKKNWDPFGAPDPAARLTIEGAPFTRFAVSGRDGHVVYLGWTGVTLKSGTVLGLSATDMDLARHDFIGSAEVTWDGESPILFTDEDFEADCRFIAADAVAGALSTELSDAEARLDEFHEAQVPNPDAHQWGYPTKAAGQAARAISSAAGLGGWRDAGVVKLAARYDQLELQWLDIVGKSIVEERNRLPVVGTPVKLAGELEASVVESVCDQALANKLAGHESDRGGCFIRMHLRNAGTAPFTSELRDIAALEQASLVLPDGTSLDLNAFYGVLADKTRLPEYAENYDEPLPSFTLPPGATMEIGLRATHDELPLGKCNILRIDKHRMRLR